jgi:hypothetical protein
MPQFSPMTIEAVRGTRPEHPDRPVRAPGDRGRSRVDLNATAADPLEVPDTTLEMLGRMAEGESLAELSSNPLFN